MKINSVINIIKNTLSKIVENKFNIGLLYLVCYVILFVPIIKGVGNYWDWSFPYFSDQMSNFFSNQSLAWSSVGIGSPMSYAADYFFRLVISLFNFVQPELLMFFILVVACTIGSIVMYLLVKERGSVLAFLGGLAIFINPVIFYKLIAGHVYYIIAYTLFIFLIYYLLERYTKRFVDVVVISLLLSFMGVQVQFFFFGFIFLMVYFFIQRDKFSWKGIVVPIMATIMVNLVWLTNFISGGIHVSSVSGEALKNTFAELMNSSFYSIIKLSFSEATFIERYYDKYFLLGFIGLSVLVVALILYVRNKTKKMQVVALGLATFFLLGLQGSIIFSIYPLSILAPMFREVGHIGPIFFLFLIMSILILSKNVIRGKLLMVLLVLFIGINSHMYIQHYTVVNFSQVRSQFKPFKKVIDEDMSQYRILSYPFFEQYSFQNIPTQRHNGVNLNNSGYDSFAKYAGKSFIINNVRPYEFQESLQNKLLTDFKLDQLRALNVKYIFDFSDIYESNYNDYVVAETYNNDVSLIKNSESFFPTLLEKNNTSLEKIGEHIYEIKDFHPYIGTFQELYWLSDDDKKKVLDLVNTKDFYFTTSDTQDNPHVQRLKHPMQDKDIILIKNILNDTLPKGLSVSDQTVNALYTKFTFLQSIKNVDPRYLFQNNGVSLESPKNIIFKNVSPVEKIVHIEGATTSFYLVMSERYHDKWRLQFDQSNWVPEEDHFILNDTLNAWFVDIDNFCLEKLVCQSNADGSYNMNLQIIFTPQRWFVLGRTISFITVFFLIGYLIRYKYKKHDRR